MTDDTRGTLHQLLHVRPPQDVRFPTSSRTCTRDCWNPSSSPPEQTCGSKRLNWRRPDDLPVVDKEMLDTNMKHMLATVTLAVVGILTTIPAGAQMEGNPRRTRETQEEAHPDARPRAQSTVPYTNAVTPGTSSCLSSSIPRISITVSGWKNAGRCSWTQACVTLTSSTARA